MQTTKKIHIFYDDHCQLCMRFKDSLNFLCQKDLYQFHGIEQSETYEQFPHLDPEKLKESIHILTERGEWLIGPAAIQYLISECPKVESFKWLIQSQAGTKASELFYHVSNKIRKNLKSQCPSCAK